MSTSKKTVSPFEAERQQSANASFHMLQNLSKGFEAIHTARTRIAQAVAELAKEEAPSVQDDLIGPNGKPQCLYTKNDILKQLFDGAQTPNLAKKMEQLGIGGVYKEGPKTLWRVTQKQRNEIAQRIADTFHPKVREECESVQIFLITNLKGGSVKSTLTVNLAGALATAMSTSYKVLVIDLDPQASLTESMYINFPEYYENNGSTLSVGDLLCRDFEAIDGVSFEEEVRRACLKTNIDNLDLLPAIELDTKFDIVARARKYENPNYNPHDDLKKIIEAVKDQYDIILIDSSPQLNEALLAGLYVANHLVLPLMPSNNDRSATRKFVKQLPHTFKEFAQKHRHKGYDSVSLALTNTRESTSNNDLQFVAEMQKVFSNTLLPTFQHSEAVKRCGDANLSLFDLSPSQYGKKMKEVEGDGKESSRNQFGSRTQLETAQENIINIASYLEQKAISVWQAQRAAAGCGELEDLL